MLDQGACSFNHPLRFLPLALRSQEKYRPGRGGSSLIGVWAAIKQGDPHEKLLSFRLFLSEHFLGKVFKDIPLRLLQHRQRIDLLLIPLSQSLPLRHLPHQLQRGNPAVRPLAILAQLFARQR